VLAAVAVTGHPLGAQIDAVLERLRVRGRGDAGAAIREVLDEYADALTSDMRSTAFTGDNGTQHSRRDSGQR